MHYYSFKYDTKERFTSYWHQIHEIISLEPETILEIGVGNKFLSDYLKKRNYNIISLDIEHALRPDVIGSVTCIPFANASFDAIACYEVLEHLPFSEFGKALREIRRVAKKYVVISLPDVTRSVRFFIHLPKLGIRKILLEYPAIKPNNHIFNGEHYWEIGKKGYALRNIIDNIQTAGLVIMKTYRVFEFPYHRFFVLKKDIEDNNG